MFARQAQRALQSGEYLFALVSESKMLIVEQQPRDESFLPGNAIFCLGDMSASLRHRVFTRAVSHRFLRLGRHPPIGWR